MPIHPRLLTVKRPGPHHAASDSDLRRSRTPGDSIPSIKSPAPVVTPLDQGDPGEAVRKASGNRGWALLRDVFGNDPSSAKTLVDFRATRLHEIVDQIRARRNVDVVEVGSQGMGSDVDITFIPPRLDDKLSRRRPSDVVGAVRDFYSEVEKEFGAEAPRALDANAYWGDPLSMLVGESAIYAAKLAPASDWLELEQSMVTLRSVLDDTRWAHLVRSAERGPEPRLAALAAAASNQWAERKRAIANRTQVILREHPGMDEGDARVKAMVGLYTERAARAQELVALQRQIYDERPQDPSAAAKLVDRVARLALEAKMVNNMTRPFAQESYYTDSAIQSVVVEQQGGTGNFDGAPLPLTPVKRLASAQEQIANAIEKLHDVAGGDEVSRVVKASKYLDRFLTDAVVALPSGHPLHQPLDQLKSVVAPLLEIRKGQLPGELAPLVAMKLSALLPARNNLEDQLLELCRRLRDAVLGPAAP
jgi:hypothetical protein